MVREDAWPDDLTNELADLLFREQASPTDVIALMDRYPKHADAVRLRARSAGILLPDDAMPGLPAKIGPYRVLRELGRGGFGVVYLAEGREGGAQNVAVKVLKDGMNGAEILARFRQEHRVLASLQHPSIAGFRDVGIDPSGRAYFAMEYVDGQPIHLHCREQRPSVRERVELMVQVAAGIAHAHQRAVLHRDLKPANILITRVDGEYVPKIIDFGLAKSLAPAHDDHAALTARQERLGTLAYMAPEQHAPHRFLRPGELPDARVDVYAVGAVLYEMLAGRPAFPQEDAHLKLSLEEQIVECAPAFPSREAPSSKWHSSRDVDLIALKALEKEADRRYQSISDMARDLERFLRNEPVEAKPPSATYRLGKFIRRHRVGVMAASLVALVLLVGAIGTIAGFVNAKRNAEIAEGNAAAAKLEGKRAKRVSDFQAILLGQIDVAKMGRDVRRRLLASLREAHGEQAEEATEQSARWLEQALSGADFTQLTRDTLMESVFRPTLAGINESFTEDPLIQSHLFQAVSRTLRKLGLLNEAMAPQRRALELREAELGPSHRLTLHSAYQLGGLLFARGKLAEARQQLENNLGLQRRTLGAQHSQTLDSMHLLSGLLHRMGDTSAARAMSEQALRISRRIHGNAHHRTLALMDTLSMVLYKEGDLEGARRLGEEALENARSALGHEAPQTLSVQNNLGWALMGLGRFERARALFREALDALRQVRGAEHPQTLETMSSVASALQRQGKLTEARAVAESVLGLKRRVFGNTHFRTLDAMSKLSVILYKVEDWDGLRALAEEELTLRRRMLPEESAAVMLAKAALGDGIKHQGRLARTLRRDDELEEARGHAERALGSALRLWGPDHATTKALERLLARCR